MKTSKLLFVLAIAAGFAACTKEVLVEPEKTVDSFDEIKGAKVLANGFSVDLAPEAQTKVDVIDGIAQFVKDDVAGVAWFVEDGVLTADQSDKGQTKLYANAYANHKITHDGMGFKSNSNVYEGWHIAYFPYQEMRKPGWLTFTVNPELDRKITDRDSYNKEQLENSVMFSAAYFLGQDDVKEGIIQTKMPLQYVVNALRPRFALAADFKAEDILKKSIKSVKLSANQPLFAETLTVNPSKFPSGEGKFNKGHFGANDDPKAVNSSDAALQARPAYVDFVTTNVAENVLSEYKLGSGDLNFRWFVAPMPKPSKKLTVANFTVTVTLDDDSEFVLTAGKDTESPNYKAFKKLADYINGDLKNAENLFLQDIILDKNGHLQAINLDFALSAAEYQITHKAGTPEEWRAVVDFASSMGAEEVDITLTGNFEIPTVDGEMYTKGLAISLKGNKTLNFTTDTKWSDNISLGATSVNVAKGATLRVGEKGLTATGNITNAGTIVLLGGAGLNVGNKKTITNTGNIEVSVGSELTAKTVSNTGTVVFTVKETVAASDIKDLVDKASLNKLVVNNASVESIIPVDWTGVTVELNGAVLAADVTADAINVNEGENAINGNITAPAVTVAKDAKLTFNGNIAGDVSVAGTAKINAAMIDGNGNLEIVSGGNVTLTGTSQYGFMQTGMIVNNGTLTVNSDVYVAGIETNPGSKTTTKKEFTIWYPDTYHYENNGGSVTGKIKKYHAIEQTEGYQIYDGVYFVNAQHGLARVFSNLTAEDVNPVISLDSDVTLDSGDLGGVAANGTITINANDSEITFNETGNNVDYISVPEGVKLVVNDATISRSITGTDLDPHTDALIFDCEVEFNNVIFTNFIELAKGATLTNVTVSSSTNNYGIWVLTHGQTVTLAGKNSINMPNGRGIKICDTHTTHEIAAPTLNVAGTTFVTAEKAAIVVRSKKGATINWLEGNNIDGVTADKKNEIWIDNAMGTDYDYFNNVTVNGADKSIEPTI